MADLRPMRDFDDDQPLGGKDVTCQCGARHVIAMDGWPEGWSQDRDGSFVVVSGPFADLRWVFDIGTPLSIEQFRGFLSQLGTPLANSALRLLELPKRDWWPVAK